uniref:Transthyretin-like family protein n=1 Tax=Rhabditophanes sp. KR3021 TaxID=114890 RepID=A0AC35U5I2_9BILA
MSKYILTILLVLIVAFATVEALRKQGMAVKGKLYCGQFPAFNNTKVRLVDIDSGPDPDDTLDEKFIDADGSFKLLGHTRELTDIDVVMYIWHDCMDLEQPCQRKTKLVFPKKYIISGEPEPENWVDIGVLNLEGSFDDEKRECIQ